MRSDTGQIEAAKQLILQGDFSQAESLLKALLRAEPANAEAWYRLGNAIKGLGRFEEASESYRRAIEHKEAYPAALCNLGSILFGQSKSEEALKCFDRAIEVDPLDAIAHYNRALTLRTLVGGDAALASLEAALQIRPTYVEALYARGMVQEEAQRWQAALQDYKRVLALQPEWTGIYPRTAFCLARVGDWNNALGHYDMALEVNGSDSSTLLHRGNVLRELHRWREALDSYDRAIQLDPRSVEGHFNRGLLLEQMSRVEEALQSFERAIMVAPENAQAQHSRSLALLMLGRLAEGFASYEWRWRNRPTIAPEDYRDSIPLWNKRFPIAGRSILVFSEQGLGDTLQFSRFVPLLASHGARVIFEVQAPLLPLLAKTPGAIEVVTPRDPLPPVDLKIPLMSLPHALGTDINTIPAGPRLLRSDPDLVEQWANRLGERTVPRIGLAWSGNPQQPEDRNRRVPLAKLVAYLPREFHYFGLQRDLLDSDRTTLKECTFISKPDANMEETAALCECMDLVISVCTSVAHLAGGLGRPLWVLLASNADWRWFLDRDDSPWYPSATLYRQSIAGEWHEPLSRLRGDLLRKFAGA